MARITIYKEIMQYLLELIAQNQSKSNYMLPSEQQLSIKFKCSRLPAKRALNELSEQGVITRIPGKGSYINPNISSTHTRFFKKNICVIMPELKGEFFQEILHGITDELNKSDAALFYYILNNKKDSEKIVLDSTFRLFFDGLIIFPGVHKMLDTKFTKIINDKSNYPLMFVANQSDNIHASSVINNSNIVIRDIISHLLDKGYTKIGFISEPDKTDDVYARRISEYKRCMKMLNEPYRLCTVDFNDINEAEANVEEQFERFFSENPDMTALIAVNYAVDYLSKCNSFFNSSITSRSLVIIDRPEKGVVLPFKEILYLDKEPYQMGCIAAKQILQRIEHISSPSKIVMPPKLSKFSSGEIY